MRKLADLISELKRRRVFRVAVVYAGVAFIIFQIVDATFDPLHIPDWVSGLVIILLLLDFLVAVGMAWAFDLTAEGLVRAKPKREPTAPKASYHIVIGNKTLAVITALAVIAAAWSWLIPSPKAYSIWWTWPALSSCPSATGGSYTRSACPSGSGVTCG